MADAREKLILAMKAAAKEPFPPLPVYDLLRRAGDDPRTAALVPPEFLAGEKRYHDELRESVMKTHKGQFIAVTAKEHFIAPSQREVMAKLNAVTNDRGNHYYVVEIGREQVIYPIGVVTVGYRQDDLRPWLPVVVASLGSNLTLQTTMLWDTGASFTLISGLDACMLGLRPGDGKRVVGEGFGGDVEMLSFSGMLIMLAQDNTIIHDDLEMHVPNLVDASGQFIDVARGPAHRVIGMNVISKFKTAMSNQIVFL